MLTDAFDLVSTTEFLLHLLDTPSPTGMTAAAVLLILQELGRLGLTPRRSAKGALSWTVSGRGADHVAFYGHVDTLGAMVSGVAANGRLRLSQLGEYDWTSIEGAEVLVHRKGMAGPLSGTVVNTIQSMHVHGNSALRALRRDQDSLEVRLDEHTQDEQQTRALGVQVGNFVSFRSGATLTPSGYIKGRHLDNKLSVAVFLGVTRELLSRPPRCSVSFFVSVHEEVGHGGADWLSVGLQDCTELIAVDMAAVGQGQQSSERHVTLCLKDLHGPYDDGLSTRLQDSAVRASIPLRLDLYPYYVSDGSAAWFAGYPAPVALIGPGVDASHAYERTHQDALVATAALMLSHVLG